MTSRAWLVLRSSAVDALIAAGAPEGIARQINRVNGKAKPDECGFYALVHSDGDIRRRPWGIYAAAPIAGAQEIDPDTGRPIAQVSGELFGIGRGEAPKLFD